MFTCGVTGRGYTPSEVFQRTDYLSRALKAALGWDLNEGTEWDRVVAVYSHNTVNTSCLLLVGMYD